MFNLNNEWQLDSCFYMHTVNIAMFFILHLRFETRNRKPIISKQILFCNCFSKFHGTRNSRILCIIFVDSILKEVSLWFRPRHKQRFESNLHRLAIPPDSLIQSFRASCFWKYHWADDNSSFSDDIWLTNAKYY